MKLPLRTLIVEDDSRQAKMLVKRIMDTHSDLLIVEEHDIAYSFDQAKSLLEANEYALSILDIKIGDNQRCFDLFKQIDTSRLGIVAYITGYNDGYTKEELAIINPHFFINKPANIYDLGDFVYDLRKYISQLKDVEGSPSYYLFKDGGRSYVPLTDDHIYYIMANDVYSTIYYIKNNIPGKVQVRGTLKEVRKQFPSDTYWHIQKSFVVNVLKVDKYGPLYGNGGDVIFLNNITFPNVSSEDRIKYSQEYLNRYIKNLR